MFKCRVEYFDLKDQKLTIFSVSAELSGGQDATVIYSSEHGISKSFHQNYVYFQRMVDETLENQVLYFSFKSGDSERFIYLHKNYTDLQVSGIAVETFPTESGYKADEKLCLEKTSQKLRLLVKRCYGNVLIRDLTDGEKKELKNFKNITRSLKGSNGNLLFFFYRTTLIKLSYF